MKTQIVLLFFCGFFLIACKNDNRKDHSAETREVAEPNKEFSFPEIPEEIILLGEKIKLQDEDLKERLDREILAIAYFHSHTTLGIKRAARYFPAIEKILKKEKLPEDLKYLAVIESNLSNVSSPAGALGFWQFMPQTAKEFGLQVNDRVDERMNLELSTMAACSYLRDAKDSLGDWLLAIAAYNRGIAGVKKDMFWQESEHYFDTYMNSETSRYVFRLIAVKLIFENPEAYGYHIDETQLYKPLETNSVALKENIDDLAHWSREKGYNYKIIRKINPWILGNSLSINDGSLELLIPAKNEKLQKYSYYN